MLTVCPHNFLYIMVHQEGFIICQLHNNTIPLNISYCTMNKINFYYFILLCHGYFLIAAAKSRLGKVELQFSFGISTLPFPSCHHSLKSLTVVHDVHLCTLLSMFSMTKCQTYFIAWRTSLQQRRVQRESTESLLADLFILGGQGKDTHCLDGFLQNFSLVFFCILCFLFSW